MSDTNDTVTIYGDTEAIDLMTQINEALVEFGLEFEDISDEGADHVVYRLVNNNDDDDDQEQF